MDTRQDFRKIKYILGHKARLNKLWEAEKKKNLHPILPQMNKIVYEQQQKQKKVSKLMTTEQHTVNENWVKGEIQEES